MQTPTPVGQQFAGMLASFDQRLRALERQQQMVITDPTRASGDPAHGYAVIVLGSLAAICGINAFGLGYWNGSTWQQLG